jgi:hypothetical protein
MTFRQFQFSLLRYRYNVCLYLFIHSFVGFCIHPDQTWDCEGILIDWEGFFIGRTSQEKDDLQRSLLDLTERHKHAQMDLVKANLQVKGECC